ncbi:alpha/beta fold hydrolase [Marinobacter confluentis]|uniref:Alpha/beta fold hydrolase n=1 Tax=Marinobacter confluentis TaxID=1697557 RepID=A0A4Z1C9J6_9GAMM|nr:alpha/beta fold hydrolase [Marinobacter confluentis]TGN40046.1 alpha/beta fold hydrolase [Marinobacter confluentis]
MTALSDAQSLVVIGGWGVDARMLQAVVARWPGRVHFVSLGDELLSLNQTLSDVALGLVSEYSQPAAWLGWSQGAQVVMAAANLPGTPVEKVITLAGFPRFVAGDGWTDGMAAETFEAFRMGLAADANRTWRRFQQLLIHGCPGEESNQARKELSRWIKQGPVARSDNLENGLAWLAHEDQRLLWQRLEVPALHLLAGADALVQPWVKHLPVPDSSRVQVMPDMTHWPVGLKAAECGRWLKDFAAIGEAVT